MSARWLLFVVAWLPDPDDSAVWLDLVDVAALDPDSRRCHNRCRDDGRRRDDCGRRYYRRSGYDWGCYDRSGNYDRCRRYGIVEDSSNDTAYDSANETGPEVAPAASPVGTVIMVDWSGAELQPPDAADSRMG